MKPIEKHMHLLALLGSILMLIGVLIPVLTFGRLGAPSLMEAATGPTMVALAAIAILCGLATTYVVFESQGSQHLFSRTARYVYGATAGIVFILSLTEIPGLVEATSYGARISAGLFVVLFGCVVTILACVTPFIFYTVERGGAAGGAQGRTSGAGEPRMSLFSGWPKPVDVGGRKSPRRGVGNAEERIEMSPEKTARQRQESD